MLNNPPVVMVRRFFTGVFRDKSVACLFNVLIKHQLFFMSTSNANKSGRSGAKPKITKPATPPKKVVPSQEEQGKLKEFFQDEIKDIYWAEKKLVQTLPKLAKAATSEELRTAFTNHLDETK